MPYKSDQQRKFMHAKHPEIAAKWDAEIRAKKKGKLKKMAEPIFKSADPYFNEQAARWAYDLVMKMDDDTARVFTEIVVQDVLEETIEKNLNTLQRHLDHVIAKRIEELKQATVRASVSKGSEAVGYAQALALISKAGEKSRNPYAMGYRFNEADFNRDPRTGQFRTKIKHNPKKYQKLTGKQAASMGIEQHPNARKPHEKAQYQDEYRQLASFLGVVAGSGEPDQDVMLHLRDKRTGSDYTVHTEGTSPIAAGKLWDPSKEQLVGVTARPKTLNYGGAAFGLTSALGAPIQTSANIEQGVNGFQSGSKAFANSWMADGDLKNSNQRLYNRMQSGSQFVGQIAPAGSKLQVAAKFGEFVGEHGPEAERVIGPTARKTAYRYRGTEKKPDADLVHAYGVAVRNAKTRSVLGDNPSAHQIANARQKILGRTPTWDERGPGRAAVAEHLWDRERRPKGELYNLQLASGNTPPSEGIIINRDGQIATQAIGYGDDHYLPFNLKHLKALKGGEYIRTRSVGGPTSEDIYTGLMSGARQVTVVSRSGTFTVEFEPDFRGGRRHNDKARRMVRRYEGILDAVQSEQVERKDIDPAIRRSIVQSVREDTASLGLSNLAQNRLVQERIKEFKSSPEISEKDEKIADLMWRHMTDNGTAPDSDQIRAVIDNQIAAEKEYKFRLNGEGYAGALEALREQFPYYIKVNSVPTRDPERVELGIDRGYVEPGRNRPTAASAGLFGATRTHGFEGKGGKFSASEADFQSSGGRISRAPEKDKEKAAAAEGKKEEGKKSPAQILAEEKQNLAWTDAALELQKEMQSSGAAMTPADQRIMNTPTAELRTNQTAFDALARKYIAAAKGQSAAGPAYLRAAGHLLQENFSPETARIFGATHRKFTEAAYQPGADPKVVKEERDRINNLTLSGVVEAIPLTQMDAKQLEAEHAAMDQIQTVAGMDVPLEAKTNLLTHTGLNLAPNAPGMRGLLENPDKISERLEMIQRARTLQAVNPAPAAADAGTMRVENPRESGEERVREQKYRVEQHANRAGALRRHLENQPDSDDVVLARLRRFEDNTRSSLEDIHNKGEADAWITRNSNVLSWLTEEEIKAAQAARARAPGTPE